MSAWLTPAAATTSTTNVQIFDTHDQRLRRAKRQGSLHEEVDGLSPL